MGDDKLNTPDRASEHVKLTVTRTLFQPFTLASGDLEPATTGGVRSTLMPVSLAMATLLARSTQVPVTD